MAYDGTIWTPYHRPFTLLQTSNTPYLNYYTLCFFSTLKGEERKWLIVLIIRDISHFRSCIKESNHPFSPFSTVSTLSSFSLLLSFYPPPTSHKNYSMMIQKLRALEVLLVELQNTYEIISRFRLLVGSGLVSGICALSDWMGLSGGDQTCQNNFVATMSHLPSFVSLFLIFTASNVIFGQILNNR